MPGATHLPQLAREAIEHSGVRRVLVFLMVTTTVSAFVIAGGRLSFAGTRAPESEKIARDFLQASLDGDVEAALELVADSIGDEPLITPEALDSNWVIDDVRLVAAQQDRKDGGTDLVQASIKGPQGTMLTADLQLSRSSGDWKIADPFGRIEVNHRLVPFIEVNGYKVDFSETPVNETVVLSVLPGLYEFYSEPISLIEPSHGPIMFLGDQIIEVGAKNQSTSGTTVPFNPRFKLRSDSDEQVQEQVEEYVNTCIESAGSTWNEECVFGVDVMYLGSAVYENESYSDDTVWQLVEYPEAALAASDRYLNSNSFRLTFRQAGSMELTRYAQRNGTYFTGYVEYSTPVERHFTCPIWILGIEPKINADGGFDLILTKGERARDGSTLNHETQYECSLSDKLGRSHAHTSPISTPSSTGPTHQRFNMSTDPPRNQRDHPSLWPVAFISAAAVLILVIVATAVIGTLGRESEPSGVSANYSGEASAETGDILLATVTHYGGNDACPTFVFDQDSAAAADAIFEGALFGSGRPFTEDVMSAGGYVNGGVEIYLNLQSDMPQQVTVFDIRAEIIEVRESITGGTFVSPHPCGGEEIDRMQLYLNSPRPGPYLDEDQEFFDEQVIHVAPGDKQSVVVDVQLDYEFEVGAYEFQLIIDYEVNGEIASLVVDNGGHPFRVADPECPHDRYYGFPGNSSAPRTNETEFVLLAPGEAEDICQSA